MQCFFFSERCQSPRNDQRKKAKKLDYRWISAILSIWFNLFHCQANKCLYSAQRRWLRQEKARQLKNEGSIYFWLLLLFYRACCVRDEHKFTSLSPLTCSTHNQLTNEFHSQNCARATTVWKMQQMFSVQLQKKSNINFMQMKFFV